MSGLLSTTPLTVLILGAGYLGNALAELLTEAGHRAVTVDCNGQAMYEADITDAASLYDMATRIPEPDVIVLCAATHGSTDERFYRLYEGGTSFIAEHFKGKRLIYCSSTSVYGVTDGAWVTESHNVYPSTPRKAIQIRAERNILSVGGIVLRLAALYGPGRCELVTRYYSHGKALKGKLHRWVNYIHRDDAANALLLLCTRKDVPPGIYNAVDQTPMLLSEIYAYLSGLLGLPMPSEEPLPPHSRRGLTNQRVSCSRLLSLGWEPLYPAFPDGVHHILHDIT